MGTQRDTQSIAAGNRIIHPTGDRPQLAELPTRPSSGIGYRLGQFVQGFAAKVEPAELELAAALLPRAAWPLFARLPVDAQRHSLNVLYDVQSAGFHDRDLAAAALLHDAGKVEYDQATGQAATLGLWWRGPLVVLEWLMPAALGAWAKAQHSRQWRRLLYRHLHHPQIGARDARQAGCSDMTCRLIAHHQDTTGDMGPSRFRELLHVLQWADSRN